MTASQPRPTFRPRGLLILLKPSKAKRKVDLHDAPLGPYEVDEWQHYTLNGEDHHHPVIVGQDGRIHLPLPAALWEPITEPAPEATTPGDER